MTNDEAISLLSDIRSEYNCFDASERPMYHALSMAIEALKAQDKALNEWCTDCKEYDSEMHRCPRFNRVIRTALQDSNLHSACTEVAQDTISRAEAIRIASGYCHPANIAKELEKLPSAEPEIIRCKDCKYWGKRGLCEKWDHYISNEVFYCGCAERRNNE